MQRLALLLTFAISSANAQSQQPLTPEQDAFAREMISCGQKYVALKLLKPGSASPMQIMMEGRTYPAAARKVAGDAFVDQETPAIRQSAMEYVSKTSNNGERDMASAIAEVKRECDAKLAAFTSGEN